MKYLAALINILLVTADYASCCHELTSDYKFNNENYKNYCCQDHSFRFKHQWFSGRRYLVKYLDTMKAWDCFEFHKECQNPLYNYTDYTRLVYDYFCDYDKYQDVCRESLTLIKPGFLGQKLV